MKLAKGLDCYGKRRNVFKTLATPANGIRHSTRSWLARFVRIVSSFAKSFASALIVIHLYKRFLIVRPLAFIVLLLSICGSAADAQDKTRYWNLNWSWSDVDIQQLSKRLSSVGLEIPITATGNASVDVEVGIPLNALRSPEKYRLKGLIASKRLAVGKLVWNDFKAIVDVRDGTASLVDLHAVVGSRDALVGNPGNALNGTASGNQMPSGGQIDGSAQLQFAPMGNLSAKLNVRALRVGPIHQLYLSATDSPTQSPMTGPMTGTVDGKITFAAPYQNLTDLSLWTLDADVVVSQFQSGKFPAVNLATGPITIRDGELKAKRVQVSVAGKKPSNLMIAAHAELTGRRRFDLGIIGDDVPLTELAELFSTGEKPLAMGMLDLNLNATGRLGDGQSDWGDIADLAWKVDGKIASPSLVVAGMDLGTLEHRLSFDQQRLELTPLSKQVRNRLRLKRIAAAYRFGDESIQVDELNAEFFGGSIAGNAIFSRSDTVAHQVDLKWRDLALQIDTGAFAALAVDVQANTSGSIDWTVPANQILQISQHRGTLDVQLGSIELSGASIGEIDVKANARPGTIELESAGKLFGGTLAIRTETSVDGDTTLSDLFNAPTQGSMTVSSVQAKRVLNVVPPLLKMQPLRQRWSGALSGKIDFQRDPGQQDRVAIDTVVANLSLDGKPIARRLDLTAKLVDGRIMIDQVTGLLGDGRLDATGRMVFQMDTGQLKTAQANVRIAGVGTSEILSLISPTLAEQIDGRLSARLVVTGGDRDRVALRGSITLSDLTTFGVMIDEAHSEISGWVTNRLNRFQVDIPSISGKTGGGQLTGKLNLKSANRPSKIDMRSDWTLRRVDFAKSLKGADSASGTLGDGKLSGKLTLNADHVSGPQDLFGRFDFDLDGSSGRSIPGLTDAQSFLGPVGLAGIKFEEGRARGVIGAGRATIQEFWLSSPQVMVWAEGVVILASQRLDLQAVVSTGNFSTNNNLISTVGLFALDYATPIGLLLQINELLSNRTIFVDVVGPASDPRLRLKPLETICEGATQFLLQQLLPIPYPIPQNRNPLDR